MIVAEEDDSLARPGRSKLRDDTVEKTFHRLAGENVGNLLLQGVLPEGNEVGYRVDLNRGPDDTTSPDRKRSGRSCK